MSNIRRNFFYSCFLTTANYIFPLLTYPYVSRILGVSNIGLVNFIDGIINYFVLFSTMGIGVIGIREIASNKKNINKLSETFSSLISLSFLFTIFAIILLIVLTYYIKDLRDNSILIQIGALKLIFNLFLIEWFYKGLEDFKYITFRTLTIRTIYVISVFVFVRNKFDYPIYYLLSCLMIVINAVVNYTYSRKFVRFTFKGLKLYKHLKSFIILGLYNILTSMYTTFNIIYLGFIGGDTEVGFYTTATKLYSIILSIFTAFTGVMLPRMSSLVHEGKNNEFKIKIQKSIAILINIAIPAVILSEIITAQIIQILSGPGYEGAINPMRIVMPLILIIGYEQILVIQMLMPLKKDGVIMRNSLIGAVWGLIMNICIVPKMLAIGSAIVWVSSEILILILSQYSLRNLIPISSTLIKCVKEIIIYSPLVLILSYIIAFRFNYWITFAISLLITIIYSIFCCCLRTENEVGIILKTVFYRIKTFF